MQRENAEEDEAKSQMKNIRLGVGESTCGERIRQTQVRERGQGP